MKYNRLNEIELYLSQKQYASIDEMCIRDRLERGFSHQHRDQAVTAVDRRWFIFHNRLGKAGDFVGERLHISFQKEI